MGFVEVFVQTFLAFFAILIYTRILSKRQIGQLTFFEYINGITFGSIAAVLATDIDPQKTLYNLLGLTLFAAWTFLAAYVSLKSRPVRKVIAGEPTVVIHNGKVLEGNLKKMHYNLDEMLMQLREKDIFDIGDVEYAVLEPSGALSVAKKSQMVPATREDLKISSEYEGISTELIMDGSIIHQNLKQLGLDDKWLLNELNNHGIKDIKDVNLAILSSQGDFYVDLKKDNLDTPVDITDDPKPPSS
ncbi:MAG: DUF421 domain-containing protein [Clostridia bacterium]|nr:DUF421 domain-containing protein [Clostridia bacterium]